MYPSHVFFRVLHGVEPLRGAFFFFFEVPRSGAERSGFLHLKISRSGAERFVRRQKPHGAERFFFHVTEWFIRSAVFCMERFVYSVAKTARNRGFEHGFPSEKTSKPHGYPYKIDGIPAIS